MRIALGLLIFALTVLQAHAAPVRRLYQDVKLPTQNVVEKQTITGPLAGASTVILSANAGNTSAAAATVSSFSAQPDVPRNVIITPGGTTSHIAGGTIVVNGTNIFNKSISENFVISASQSADSTGSKAFKTITSIVFPANLESSPFDASWTVKAGSKLGLKRCMANTGDVIQALLGGTKEGTYPTNASSATAIESNTVTLNSTLVGGSDVVIYFIQNFGCFP